MKKWISVHFQWLWASHASHSTEEIMRKSWKQIIFNDSWLPTPPTQPKKLCKMNRNPCIVNDSGLPTLTTSQKKPLQMFRNPRIFNDSGFPKLLAPLRESWHFRWFWAPHASHFIIIAVSVRSLSYRAALKDLSMYGMQKHKDKALADAQNPATHLA